MILNNPLFSEKSDFFYALLDNHVRILILHIPDQLDFSGNESQVHEYDIRLFQQVINR